MGVDRVELLLIVIRRRGFEVSQKVRSGTKIIKNFGQSVMKDKEGAR